MPRGGAFYDAPGVLERYREPRPPGVSDPNFVMEEPALLDQLGSIDGLRVADLGCGDAALGRVLLSGGCARYLGLDGSEKMVRAAREMLRGTHGEVVHGDIEGVRRGARGVRPRGLEDGAALCRAPRARAGLLPRLPRAGRSGGLHGRPSGHHVERRTCEHGARGAR